MCIWPSQAKFHQGVCLPLTKETAKVRENVHDVTGVVVQGEGGVVKGFVHQNFLPPNFRLLKIILKVLPHIFQVFQNVLYFVPG